MPYIVIKVNMAANVSALWNGDAFVRIRPKERYPENIFFPAIQIIPYIIAEALTSTHISDYPYPKTGINVCG